MIGLCGWFDASQAATPPAEAIQHMATAMNRSSSSGYLTAVAPFGCLALADRQDPANIFRCDDVLIAVWGDVRFNEPSVAAMGSRDGPARAFAFSYASKDRDVFKTLSGSFAVVILDRARRIALLAVDRMGSRPFYYTVVGKTLVFGSNLDALSEFPGALSSIDPQALFTYVHSHVVPGPETIYKGRHRLAPGTMLRYAEGHCEVEYYWHMQFSEREHRPFDELKHSFLTVLKESVRSAANGRAVGCFLSGGTDSSTIAGMLGDVTAEPARTYSIGFEAAGYDEMEYARIAARHFGTRHHEYYVTPDDVVRAIPRIAAVHDQPFGNASAIPTYYCAELARADGIDVLLGGDGGDELFGGNYRYAKQYLYSLYSDLPLGIRNRIIDPIISLAPEIGLLGKIQRYVRHASEPMPARYDNYNLLDRLGAEHVFAPDFVHAVDTRFPQKQREQVYLTAQAESLINRMLAVDLKFTLADDDIPKVLRSCELAGVQVRFPMLDDAVVAFSAKLPPRLKLKGTQLRYFFKKALRGYLPDAIITKTKHGFGLPLGPWVQSHSGLRALVNDSLSDLRKRRLIRPEFLDELMDRRLAEHAAYYGTMAWVLMMLEQWFQQRRFT
jgi:asparagine synthase (glutamine-hydrolysing)